MAITAIQHRKAYLQSSLKAISEVKPVKGGFSSLFPTQTYPFEEISIELERGLDLISIDVDIFGPGTKNKATKSTQNIYIPPGHIEELDYTASTVYQRMWNEGAIPSENRIVLGKNQMRKDALRLVNKIQRGIQKQQADVLQTGIVTVVNGDSIDFRRPAASRPDLGSGNYWNEANVNPLDSLSTGAKYLVEEGNCDSREFNVFMGREAAAVFMGHEKVKEGAEWRNIRRVDIGMPEFDRKTGFTYHGQIVAGTDYTLNIWTYSEGYRLTEAGNKQYYLAGENVVILPTDFKGETAFAAVPYMDDDENIYPMQGDFVNYHYVDRKTKTKTIQIQSRPLVVPYYVNKIYSLQALATS